MQITLSNRMQLAADMVSPGHRLADVGTDHGFLPIFLVLSGKVPYAIAMDLREGPLQRAREHVDEYGLKDQIELRLADGLQGLTPKDHVDTVSIMGMGGRLITKILEEGKENLSSVSELILGPQSDLSYVRDYLSWNGFRILEERMVLDEEKYYVFLRVAHGKAAPMTAVQRRFGASLLEKKDPVLWAYLMKEMKIKQEILKNLKEEVISNDRVNERISQVEEKLQLISEAMKCYNEQIAK